jgi:hypothetical protein
VPPFFAAFSGCCQLLVTLSRFHTLFAIAAAATIFAAAADCCVLLKRLRLATRFSRQFSACQRGAAAASADAAADASFATLSVALRVLLFDISPFFLCRFRAMPISPLLPLMPLLMLPALRG